MKQNKTSKTLNLLEENIEEYTSINDMGINKYFLATTQKKEGLSIKKIDKLDINLNIYLFFSYICHIFMTKNFVFRTYKQHLQLNNNKTTNKMSIRHDTNKTI